MAQYRAGTVTVTTNSATVFGQATTWKTSGIEPGHWFTIRDEGITYTVAAVLAEDQLVLSAAYQGVSKNSAFYLLHTDFTPRGYAVPGPNDVEATMIVRRAIYDIDADMTRNLGSSGGGSSADITIASIKDLNSSTALTGQILTKLADGSYGFTAPASLNVSLINMVNAGTAIGQAYAGINASGAHQFRAIQVVGGTLTQNTDRLTITVPAVGETNTLAGIGSAESVSIAAPKTGTALNTYGLRGVNGVSVVRDQNDIVISGSGTGGGGTTTGEANTGENLGATGTTVVRVFSDKLNTSLRFRTILFSPDHFTVAGETTGQYTVTVRRQKLSDSPDTDLANATAGQILRLEADKVWRGQPMPVPGIPNLQADTTPRLGGDLATAGRRIIGVAGTLSGMIEKPKDKTYTLILKSANQISISSVSAQCGSGTVNFSLFLGFEVTDNPSGPLVDVISGTAVTTGITEVIPGDSLQVPAGSRLSLKLSPQGASSSDFVFSIAHAST
jgi:hypothetical protein